MTPEIRQLSDRQLIGMKTRMSLANNTTSVLWHQFMSRRKEILHQIQDIYYSIQNYGEAMTTQTFTPMSEFEKWAGIEVDKIEEIPEGMEAYTLSGGQYAVFKHKGPTSAAPATFNYIYNVWLPQSGYTLDDRNHFERLGEKYLGPLDPESEEEIFIPIS